MLSDKYGIVLNPTDYPSVSIHIDTNTAIVTLRPYMAVYTITDFFILPSISITSLEINPSSSSMVYDTINRINFKKSSGDTYIDSNV